MPTTVTWTLTLPDPCEDKRCGLGKGHAGPHQCIHISPNGGGIGWWDRTPEEAARLPGAMR